MIKSLHQIEKKWSQSITVAPSVWLHLLKTRLNPVIHFLQVYIHKYFFKYLQKLYLHYILWKFWTVIRRLKAPRLRKSTNVKENGKQISFWTSIQSIKKLKLRASNLTPFSPFTERIVFLQLQLLCDWAGKKHQAQKHYSAGPKTTFTL